MRIFKTNKNEQVKDLRTSNSNIKTNAVFYRPDGEIDWQELGANERRMTEFHSAFKVFYPNTPQLINKDLALLRIQLMQEELDELKEAVEAEDLIGIADALCDQQVIADGNFDAWGMLFAKEELMQEVFKSNMSKLDNEGNPLINGENGVLDERKPLGKILKSGNFIEPELGIILKKYM